eukprot:5344022-Amphidinium_carterae.2
MNPKLNGTLMLSNRATGEPNLSSHSASCRSPVAALRCRHRGRDDIGWVSDANSQPFSNQ